jgi:ribose-phosphate pyrophosphokinase
MAAAAQHVVAQRLKPPVCIGVHAVFSGDAQQALLAAGATRVITTNTIPHPTNSICVHSAVATAVAALKA